MSRATCFTQLALVLVLGVGGASTLVEADGNRHGRLRGAYAFTTSRTCTVASLPFVGPIFAIPTPTTFLFRQAASDAGIITFNGDGTGTATGRSSTMNITATGGGILSVTEFTTDFTYTVNPDGTVDTAGPTVFETILGAGAGNTGTVTGQVGRLQIARGTSMLVSAPREQITNETVVINFPIPPGGSVTQHRICVRSTTATKLASKGRED